MASLGRLTIDMVANLGGFERDMGRADRVTRRAMGNVKRELRSAERDMEKARTSLKNLGMQFAALAGVSLGVVVREFHQLSQMANNLDKTSKVVGVTVEELQKLRFAAEQAAGVTSQTLDMALQRFSRRVGEAANNTGELLPVVEELGIQLRNNDGSLRSQTELLGEFANAVANTTSEQEQLRIAFKLFDSEGAKLVTLLRQGSDGLQQFLDQAEATGSILGGQAVNDFVRFNDELNVLQMRAQALSVSIGSDLIRPFADFVEFLNTEQGTQTLKRALEDITRAAEVLGVMLGVRMTGQLIKYTYELTVASIASARATVQLATMTATSNVASASFARLGLAVRTMLGPLGLIATAAALLAPTFFDVKDSFNESTDSAEDLTDKIARLTGNMKDLKKVELESAFADMTAEAQKTRTKINEVAREIQQLESEADDVFGVNPAVVDLRQYLEELKQTYMGQVDALNAINKALDKLSEEASDATDPLEELNEQLSDPAVEDFRRSIEDLAAELEGPAAQAMLQFNRDLGNVYALLGQGKISFQEATSAIALFYQQMQKSLSDNGKDLAGNLASSLANAISIGEGRSVGDSLGNAIKSFGAQGLNEGIQEAMTEALQQLNLDDAKMQAAFVAIGEAIGGNIGAAIGTTIGATIGAVLGAGNPIWVQIGAQIGNAIGTLLDPQKDPKFQIGGQAGFASTGGMPKGSFATVFGVQLFRFRNIEDAVASEIEKALVDFDNAIASFITDETQLSAITAALERFAFDSQDEAASVQELLEKRFNAILGTFDSFTQSIVRQAFGLEAQVNRLAELQEVQRRVMFSGMMGFADQNALIGRVADMQRGTETLVDTFDRLVGTMAILQQVAELTGVSIRDSHEGLVSFGDELLKLFGDDMQKFTASMNKIFDTFFEASEVLDSAAKAERERATMLLESIGVEVNAAMLTAEGFRTLFETLLPTLSAQDAAVLIEAGVSLANFIDLQDRATAAREEEANALARLTASGEAFAQAMISTEETIALAPLNDFQRDMVGINRQLFRTINAINAAAGASITQEAAERALARAHEAAAIQASAAVARLEASTSRLIDDVFGTPLSEIDRQIQELQRNSTGAAGAIGSTVDAMASLIAFADSLLVGQLSPLPSRQRLDVGLEQLIAASEAGDVQAVQSLAQQVLQIGRERFATGPEFAALFQQVQDIIRGTVPSEADAQNVIVTSAPGLEDLFKRRDAILQEQAERDRKANAFDIAQSIADISSVTGESFAEVAERLGVPMNELASILGMDMAGLDSLLSSLMVDTMTLAQTLENYAKEIRDSILQMTNAILDALNALPEPPDNAPITEPNPVLPGPIVGPFPPSPQPPPPPALPPVDPIINDPVGPNPPPGASDPQSIEVAKNTKDTVVAINRLADSVERSNTRSSRTALA